MTKLGQIKVQLGKQGVTPGYIELLKNMFSKRENVKIQVLKSAGHEKEKMTEIAEEIVDKLGKNYTYKILGFAIFVKKWKKDKR